MPIETELSGGLDQVHLDAIDLCIQCRNSLRALRDAETTAEDLPDDLPVEAVKELVTAWSDHVHGDGSDRPTRLTVKAWVCQFIAEMPAADKRRLASGLGVNQTTLNRWISAQKGYRGPPPSKVKAWIFWSNVLAMAAQARPFNFNPTEENLKRELPDGPLWGTLAAPLAAALSAVGSETRRRFERAIVAFAEGKELEEVLAEHFPELKHVRALFARLLDDAKSQRFVRALLTRFPEIRGYLDGRWAQNYVDVLFLGLQEALVAVRNSSAFAPSVLERFEGLDEKLRASRETALDAWYTAFDGFGSWTWEFKLEFLKYHPVAGLLQRGADVELAELLPKLEATGLITRNAEAEHSDILASLGEAYARLKAFEERQATTSGSDDDQGSVPHNVSNADESPSDD